MRAPAALGSVLAVIAVSVILAGCGTSSSTAASASTDQGPSAPSAGGGSRCRMTPGPDLVVWIEQRGSDPYATTLGATDTLNCEPTVDYFRDTVSQDPTYRCVLIGLASSNPGYDVNADPAPRPKNLSATFGPDC